MPRIVLDAMGGDRGPDTLVRGALQATCDGVDVVLVGHGERLSAALWAAGEADRLEVVDASEVIGMDEDPAIAVRAKPDASVRVAAQMVADGRADGMVSAGSTGATLAAALLSVGRIPGVRRPVVAVLLPLTAPERLGVVLVDAGGTADVHPEGLVDAARMGAAYAHVLGVGEPALGLLNVGAEPGKGNALTRAASVLLTGTEGFVGNVEPADVLDGAVDVVVTDGFTGNIFLKALEAAHRRGSSDVTTDDHGAAVLLGVRGEVLVAHGAADAHQVAAAVAAAARVVEAGLALRVAARLAGPDASPRETLSAAVPGQAVPARETTMRPRRHLAGPAAEPAT